jgi:hypothetical protein
MSKNSGSKLTGDISELAPQNYWEVPFFSKGEVVGGYGTQPLSQASDGAQADAAFRQQADPIGPAGSLPPQEPGDAKPPVETQREPQAPYDVWATGAGEP